MFHIMWHQGNASSSETPPPICQNNRCLTNGDLLDSMLCGRWEGGVGAERIPERGWLSPPETITTLLISCQFRRSVVSDPLRPQQHARLPCPSPTPRSCSDSWLSSQWCHPTISQSVVPFSSCLQSFPALVSFPMSHFFASGDQGIGASASASVFPMNIQDSFPLGWTDWISLKSKGLSRVFSDTTVQKHQFFSVQLSL